MRKAIFLDRDGVLNKSLIENGKPKAPKKKLDLELLPKVPEALAMLRSHNFELVVITNQPDLANGSISEKDLTEIHDVIKLHTKLENFYVCPHSDADNCECRKPKTGLILSAIADLNLSINGSFLVGDRWRDIQAGQSVGLTCFYIDYSYAEEKPRPPFIEVASLMDATKIILKEM